MVMNKCMCMDLELCVDFCHAVCMSTDCILNSRCPRKVCAYSDTVMSHDLTLMTPPLALNKKSTCGQKMKPL